MKTELTLAMLLSLVAAALSATEEPSQSAVAELRGSPEPSGELNRLFEDYWEEYLALNPLLATMAGDHRYDDRLANDLGETYRARSKTVCSTYLRQLERFANVPLNPRDRLNRDVLKYELELRLEELSFDSHLLPVSQSGGLPVMLPQLGAGGSLHPFQTVRDYDNFLARIRDFEVWVDTAIANMKVGMSKGVVQPKVVMNKLQPQLEAMIVSDVTRSVFYKPVSNMPAGFSEPDRLRLRQEYSAAIAERIVPAYRRLHTFIREEYLQRCRDSVGWQALPRGQAWYAFLVRHYTSTHLSPGEIFDLGMREVERLRGEMVALQNQTGFKGSLHEFAIQLERTDTNTWGTKPELIAAYERLRAQVEPHLPRLFKRMPASSYEIRAVEEYREHSASSQYWRASPDGSRPGIFYVNAARIAEKPLAPIESLFLHEAAPGHHFETSLQQEQIDQPRFRRFAWFSAYSEGWGLYCEGLGPELGCYRNAQQKMGWLSADMWRARRLVVDVGLHAKDWTREQALQFLLDNPFSRMSADLEVDRYIARPGQALAYKVGERTLARLRSECLRQLGDRFDVREFHDALLGEGALPLAMLEARLQGWAGSFGEKSWPNAEAK